MTGDGGSFGHVGVHVGTDWTVRCNTYPEHAPILNIGAASTTVALCMAGEQPSAEFAVLRPRTSQCGRTVRG